VGKFFVGFAIIRSGQEEKEKGLSPYQRIAFIGTSRTKHWLLLWV